jgi:hypothetical protein
MSAIAVLGVERLSSFPAVEQIKGNEPELGIMRVGLIGDGEGWPVQFAARFDLSEADRVTRDELRDHPLAVGDQFIDDLYARWTPRVWAGVVAGRQRVPFSVFRHVDHALLSAAAPPFLIDRVAPDRRWGVTGFGDLGSISYALGGFADIEQLEPRTGDDDPSLGGRAAIAAHVEWTPRAPMGRTHVATRRDDPWYDTLKVSAGAGALYRIRESGNRFDGSLSGRAKWMHLAAVAELILSYDDEQLILNAAGEASTLFVDRAYLFVRGDYDVAIEIWSAGTGIAYYVTEDRLNKVSFVAFVRRDTDNGPRRDAIVLQLQAVL